MPKYVRRSGAAVELLARADKLAGAAGSLVSALLSQSKNAKVFSPSL